MRRYGQWGGNSKGTPENTENCVAHVYPNERGAISHQCKRKRGYGRDGLYCKLHARIYPNGDSFYHNQEA